MDSQSHFQRQQSGPTAESFAPPGHPASANTSGLKTQLAISIGLGLGSLLAFCILRTRWAVIYAPRTKLRRHTPPVLSSTFFGWIPQLMRIPEGELLDCVGLDAAMMLRFFALATRLFTMCMIPGLLIILPINIYSTSSSDGRLPTDWDNDDDQNDPSLPGAEPRSGTSLIYLFSLFTFTWLFSLATIYSIWHTYEGYIALRREYLLKRHKSIVNRTIMVVGLPAHLQSDRALATFYESLEVGTVESAHVGRHVRRLQRRIEQRAHALRALELAYTKYYGNPSGRADYDPDAIADENDRTLDHHHVPATATAIGESSQELNHGYSPETEEETSLLHGGGGGGGGKNIKKRPMMRLGFMGIFGKKVDKIDHLREVFATLDKAVQKMRLSRVYATTSVGFVTFEEMHAAQILAQTVNSQETLSCQTSLAPEPRDVYWDNLNLPPSEIAVRTIVINVICFFLVFFWAGPVGVFSSFLNLDSLNKIFPGISKIAGKNAILKSLIQGFLPTVGVIIFLAVVPRILLALCRRQGMQSHSEIGQSLYNKYFTFILFNVFLVFTIVGTWAQAFNKVYHNLGELALTLAASLPRVAPFFVNYTILRGIGLFPLQLLQIGDVFVQVLQGFVSRTPRDYAEGRAPPELPYGIVYSNATLVFVIILIYSCIKPVILVFGVAYFAIGTLVFKYQLLYVYFHPHESGGQMWPMVYNRLTLGLVTFQLTMQGLFMLKQAYVFGVLMAPLPICTAWFWYWTTTTYKQTARFVPLELLRSAYEMYPGEGGAHRPEAAGQEDEEDEGEDSPPLIDMEPAGVSPFTSTTTNGLGHVAVDMDIRKRGEVTKAVSNHNSRTAAATAAATGISAGLAASMMAATAVVAPGDTKRNFLKSAVDEDDYQAIPDRFTDYRQPPMTLYPGVLNSGMRHYAHPALSGPLPTLWLPLQKGETASLESVGGLSKGKKISRLGDDGIMDVCAMDQDQPQTYDEGDNLAGGGQDEDDVDDSNTAIQVRDRDMAATTDERLIDIGDGVTAGPSRRRESVSDTNANGTGPLTSRGSIRRRNPAVEGIDDVYYHHPERRLSNAGSAPARWKRLVGVRADGGSRTNLLKNQVKRLRDRLRPQRQVPDDPAGN